MVMLTPLTYLMVVVPLFAVVFWVTSNQIYQRTNIRYLVAMTTLATGCSFLGTTLGEIGFGLIYGLTLYLRHQKRDLLVFVLMWDFYLITTSIAGTVIQLCTAIWPTYSTLVTYLVPMTAVGCFVIVLGGLKARYHRTITGILGRTTFEPTLEHALIVYSVVVCAFLYLLQVFFDKTSPTGAPQYFETTVFLIFTVINLITLFYFQSLNRIAVENRVFKAAELARVKYYENLEAQQSHTRRLLHDYKNLLATLDMSLTEGDADAGELHRLIAAAQTDLNHSQIDQPTLNTIKSAPLRSLVYLKWTQASNAGIRLNISTVGEITVPNSNDLLSVLKCAGILLDNALEESRAEGYPDFTLMLAKDAAALTITIINQVPTTFKLARLNQPGYTTKGGAHGNGLDIIRQIVLDHPNFNFITSRHNNHLTTTLTIEDRNHD